MTLASPFRTRPARVVGAFLVMLSVVVLIPGHPAADAADDRLTIHKSVDDNTIAHGDVSSWTLTVDTDPTVGGAVSITVVDTVPDGLCPFGAGDPDCPGGTPPTPAYRSATENPDGSWTLEWDLPDMAASQQASITYTTLARSHYQEGFADDTPVLARDSWNNTVHLNGIVDGTEINDYAAASQAGGSVTFLKEVASRPASLAGPTVCDDGSGLTWNSDRADGYRIGDQVCWRLSVAYPAGLVTRGTVVTDLLPDGHLYTAADAWAPGANNTVPVGDIDGTAIGSPASSLTWTVGDSEGYVAADLQLEIVFSSTIVDPTITTSGATVLNSATVTHVNTNGGSYNAADTARIEVIEPQLQVVKGVLEVNGVSTGGSNDVDGVEVKQTDVVTYQITVTNTGDLDAGDVELWDLLPDQFANCSGNVGSISDGGVCNDAANRIEWDGVTALSVPAGGSVTTTYDVIMPAGIAPLETMPNRAGVRTYASLTNTGVGTFTFTPVSNIDATTTGNNTTAAADGSNVFTAEPTIGIVRTTAVAEPGNDPNWEATIGELVTYTITVTIPEGTTIYNADLVDDLPANVDLVSSSHVFDGESPVTLIEDGANDAVTVEWADPSYTNAAGTGDDTLSLTVVAQVLDVPSNTRGTVVGNTAEFTWFNRDGAQHDIDAAVGTTIVEPAIDVDKTSSDTIGADGYVVGGELVNTTLLVSNPNQASVSTAHDLVVVDTLPEGMTPTIINDGGIWAPDATAGDGVGGTITWAIASLPPGSVPAGSASLTYQVVVDNPVVVTAAFTNNVAVTTTSMAAATGGERTAGVGYDAASSATLLTPLTSIAKSVAPTSATIGGVATYSLTLTVPPGMIMYDATALDVLPPGMVFDGIVATSCAMGAGSCAPSLDVQHQYSSGQTVSFFLGDIDTPASDSRILTIVYQAHVADSATASETLTNTASLHGNTTDHLVADPGFVPGPFDVNTDVVEATVSIVEPGLSIDKDVSGQQGDSDFRRAKAGTTLYYTLTLSNAAGTYSSPAYDITVTDYLPETVSDPQMISGGGVWDSGLRTITWTIPGPLAAATSLALSYAVDVDPSLDWTDENPGAAEVVNRVDITSYYGVPESERIANGHTYRTYSDLDADVVDVELDLAGVGNYIWFDVTNDGIPDPGEPPLAGVDVTITYHGADGILGSGDDEVYAEVTAADGTYGVQELPGGDYTIVVDTADIPAGLVATYDLDGTPDSSWTGSIGEDLNNEDIDFAYSGTSSVGDTIWFDIDADGTIDPSEHGLEGIGVSVNWLGLDGVPGVDDINYTTATDPDGRYAVADLPIGNYTVVVDSDSLPAGMTPTYDSDGTTSAHFTSLTLGAGVDDLAQDFGYTGSGSIGDLVWFDADGMGDQDAGESGLLGVPVQLTWPGEDGLLGGGDDELLLTTTDGGGHYTFDNLPVGEYRVDVLGALSTAAVNTHDEDGDLDSSVVVNMTPGLGHDTADFGYLGSASIGDAVWWDIDADSTRDVAEPGIAGVELEAHFAGLDGLMGNADDLSFTTTSDTTGTYLFTDLPEGDYEISILSGIPAGLIQTYDETGPLDGASAVSGLSSGEIHLGADFGYAGTGSIGDFVWLDLNADGIQDGGEPGIPGVDVHLLWYGVDGSEGSPDDVALTTTTDIDGNYSFPSLPAGGYDIIINPTTVPNGVTATFDADGVATPHFSSSVLAAGAINQVQDFGYVGGASIGDTVWFDRNGDGVFDTDEYGLGTVSIDITWAGPDDVFSSADDESFSAVTEIDGGYLIESLPPGAYTVAVDTGSLPAGLTATFDRDGTLNDRTSFSLGDGEAQLDGDFGYNGTGQVGDNVWLDLNGNGAVDTGEPGVPEQQVEISWAGPDATAGTADDQLYTTSTDAAGNYVFGNLPPGSYDLVVTGSVTTVAVNTADGDGDLDSRVAISLGDGQSHLDADFGYAGSAEIGDLIWFDADGDGNAGATEHGLAAVAVSVTWYGADATPGNADDIVLPLYATDTTGHYQAGGLPDGNYEVVVVAGIPSGLTNSADEDGNLDSRSDVIGLSAGTTHLTADFGFAGTGSVEGGLWWDLDGDAIEDVSEPGLSSTAVTLIWAGFDGIFASGDELTDTATTTSSGSYAFASLPPGEYEILVDEGSLPSGVVQSADPDTTIDGATSFNLGPAETIADQDFGYRGAGSIGDLVWIDIDNDDIQDPAEPGVADIPVDITYLGPDGVSGGDDDVVFSSQTGADGHYLLSGMPSGFYLATTPGPPASLGLIAAGDLDGGDPLSTSFTLGAIEDKLTVDYRLVGDASLSGTAWNDRNSNGAADPEEVGVAAVSVTITWQGPTGQVEMTASTDPLGNWEAPGLAPGQYAVEVQSSTLPLGMTTTTPASYSLALTPAGAVGVDFGLAFLLDVGSAIWIDNDRDGVFDDDEPGIPNVLVNLYDETGVLTGIAQTDAAGHYLFADLLPGLYLVQIMRDTLPEQLLATWDRDGSADLNTLVDLTQGADILDANFGFQTSLPVTGFNLAWFALWGALLTMGGVSLATAAALRRGLELT